MRAMILAAGTGERLRPLTNTTPKPLLTVRGEALIVRHVRRLAAAGFSTIVINLFHLGEQIKTALGNGDRFGVNILYSPESTLLAAAGGIRLALERRLLLAEPFLLVNADVYCDYDLRQFHDAPQDGAYLLLVDNPPHHPAGDFSLTAGKLRPPGQQTLTYAGMGVFNPRLFDRLPAGEVRHLKPLLLAAIEDSVAGGVHYRGDWHDVGRPEDLERLNQAPDDEHTQR